MFSEFALIDLRANLRNKRIDVLFNRDIDPHNINLVVNVYERHTRNPLVTDIEIKNERLYINFKDWPIVNTDYIVSISGIKSVIGEELSGNVKKKIMFESNVVSTVRIITPAMHEEVKKLNLTIEEIITGRVPKIIGEDDGILGNDEYVNSYYVEVSRDNAFIDNIIESVFTSNYVTFNMEEEGQYYIRVRVQSLTKGLLMYGHWSEISTFIIGNDCNKDEVEEDDEDISDEENKEEIEDDVDPDFSVDYPMVDFGTFELVAYPEIGVTPESFIFEFSKDIDMTMFNERNITIIRKEIR